MEILGIILLSISLSMDALGIGVSYSLRKIRTPLMAKIVVSFISAVFTAAATFLGNVILIFINADMSKFIGCFMLFGLGVFTIYQGLKKDEQETGTLQNPKEEKVWNFAIKSLGLTVEIIKNPISCDFDNSKHIDFLESMYLGVALSIDSVAAGVGLAVSGAKSVAIPIAVGVAQFLFLSLGNFIGKKVSSFDKINPRFFVFLSGAILITVALMRVF